MFSNCYAYRNERFVDQMKLSLYLKDDAGIILYICYCKEFPIEDQTIHLLVRPIVLADLLTFNSAHSTLFILYVKHSTVDSQYRKMHIHNGEWEVVSLHCNKRRG